MANAASGYSDFYKNNTKTPGASAANSTSSTDSLAQPMEDTSNMTMVEKRKAALRRRLMARKAST